jgi:hypothetical protein
MVSVWLAMTVGFLALVVGPAQAAVRHEYLSKITEVPASSGAPSPGRLSGVDEMTVDSGELLVAEHLEGIQTHRLDRFNASTSAFLSQTSEIPPIGFIKTGIAVGHSFGEDELYDAVEGSGVAVFGSSGALQATWSGAGTSNGSFTQSAGKRVANVMSVAVDGSVGLPGDWAEGDVYVSSVLENGKTGASYNVVSVFRPQAGGGEPAKPVAELTGTCASPRTVCSGPEVVPFRAPKGVAVDALNGEVFVLDGQAQLNRPQVVDVFRPAALTGEYEFVGSLTGPPGGKFEQTDSLAVDGTNGDLYVVNHESGGAEVVDQFDLSPTGEYSYVGSLTGTSAGPFSTLRSVAVDPLSHHVFVGDYNSREKAGVVDIFGADIVIPDVTTEAATEVSPSSARLNGLVNPDKEGGASCRFAWGTTRQFGQVAPCEPERVAEGNSRVPVHAELNGLQSDTTYYYRLQASNKNGSNEGSPGEDREFGTPGPGLHGESVSNISSTSSTLDATINPNKALTSYYFQYGTSDEYTGETPERPGLLLGSGTADIEVERHVQGLSAGTTYHYRVVVLSEVKPGVTEPFYGPDQTFSTQSVGTALSLPDGRQWELVSPVDKHGALLLPISEAGVVQASASGDAMTYLGTVPTEAGVQGYFVEAQLISDRGTGGWSSRDVGLPHASATGNTPGFGQEFRFFNEDLSLGVVEPQGEFTSLSPDVFPADTERTLYLRHDLTCASTPSTCYEPLLTGATGYADVPEGTEFGGAPEGNFGATTFVGATADLAHVVLRSTVALTATRWLTGVFQSLYEWSAMESPSEELRPVSILPQSEGGKPVVGVLGELGSEEHGGNARHAISADGSRIFWSTQAAGNVHLYLRDMTKGGAGAGETLRLDTVQGGFGEGAAEPHFQVASSDGSVVFFTDEQALTADAHALAGKRDLYECTIVERAGKDECELSDLTPAIGGEDAGVQGLVLGASNDGSYVYFVATGTLGGAENARHEKAVAGAPNLYMLHRETAGGIWETPRLIGVLSSEDEPDWGNASARLVWQTARVSADGRHLAFMSDRSLTGYDNHDANSGRPDEEVFLFDAGAGRLVCASCNPTGARPVGVEYAHFQANSGTGLVSGDDRVWGSTTWLAANVPGWTPFRSGVSRYQSRYLSEEGRLFFNSSDALVPQDINKNEDVYEYEPVGVGDCSVSSATFSERSDGCLGLISSGTAAGESGFLDASESGNDVFFMTGEKLVSRDVDTALDVYDAHACTTRSLCVSAPVAPPACTTADACRVAPLVQPGIFGAPSSATFSGAGNITEPGVQQAVRARSLTRAQQLARALKGCRKDRSRRKRGVCERQARRRYGAKQASRGGKATKKGKG